MGERWADECIVDYLEKTDPEEYARREEDDDWEDLEDLVQDAIDHVLRIEKWKGYAFIDSEESGEPFGLTIFYK